MNIAELMESRGYKLTKKTANEYSSACPFCGGNDRFCVWPDTNKYWCRQCDKNGDLIQLVRDLDGLSFKEAAMAVGQEDRIKNPTVISMTSGNKHPYQAPPPPKPEEKPKPYDHKKVVAKYDYLGFDGQLVMQVVRYEPKDFRQRRPSTAAGKEWAWDLKGVQLVLYRLPEVMKSNYVFYVEGEKDVDRLVSLGLVATCNPMGAGKIKGQQEKHEILGPLQDRKVYIIPDNDPPGKKHAAEIADLLIGIASEIKILELPVAMSGDVSDFINDLGADKAVRVLRELAAKAGKHRKETEYITIEDLEALEFPKMSNLIGDGILIDQGQLMIAGEGGLGKSLIRLEIAIHLSIGMEWIGHSVPRAKRVLICQFENGLRTEQARCRLMMKGKNISRIPAQQLVWLKQTRENRPDLTKIKDVERMLEVIGGIKPEVVIWDCLSNIHSTNENDNVKMRNVLDNLTDIANELGHAVVVIHHFGKPAENEQQIRHRFRGASSIIDWATCAFGLTKGKDPDRTLINFTNVKMRDAKEIRPFIVERNEFFCHLITSETGLVTTGEILNTITTAGDVLTKMQLVDIIAANTGCSPSTARRAVQDAIISGHIFEIKEGRNKIIRTRY